MKYIRIKDVSKYYPMTAINVRHLILHDINNFRESIIKIGGKLYIQTERLESWMDKQRMPHKDKELENDSERQDSLDSKSP